MSHGKIRQQVGTALLRFAAERSLERQDMERRMTAVGGAHSPEHANALASLTAARWFEAAMLWVGWRLSPAALTFTQPELRDH